MGAATSDLVEQFHEQGYVFLPEYFDAERVAAFREEADRILELLVNASMATGRESGRLNVTENAQGTQTVRQVNPSIDLSRLFKGLAVDELADLTAPLLDDDPVSIDRTAQLNYKQPLPEPIDAIEATRGDDQYSVHSDWAYYEGTFPPGILTSIVFLDENREDSGPLEVWPGTHTEEYEHENIDGLGRQIPDDVLDHDAGEKVTGPAGSVLIFDCRLVHSSGPNTSGRPRRLAIYGHAPASNVEAEVVDGSARPELSRGDLHSNYPSELVESTYENEYYRLKRRGEFEDRFSAPEASAYPL
jgi:ectoine hydroxylase-related dioxygenase (phytanoyl-CoA dioxygenase family)